jgi:hypothetical protein
VRHCRKAPGALSRRLLEKPLSNSAFFRLRSEINLVHDQRWLTAREGTALAVWSANLTEWLVMDYLTRSRAMAAFCRQRAKMQNEDTGFWLGEAEAWEKRAETRVLKMPQQKKKSHDISRTGTQNNRNGT